MLLPTTLAAPPRLTAPTMRIGVAATAHMKPTPWLRLFASRSPGLAKVFVMQCLLAVGVIRLPNQPGLSLSTKAFPGI